MKYDSKFEEFYQELTAKESVNSLANIEKDARKEKNKNDAKIIFSMIVYIIGFLLFINSKNFSIKDTNIIIVGFAVVFILIIITAISTSEKKQGQYTKEYKETIIKNIINNFGNYTYIPNGNISRDDYNQANFEDYYNRYYSEDLIVGNIKENINFNMAEVLTIYESTDSDGDTTRSTIFHGLFSKVNCPKHINAELYLRNNKNIFTKDLTSKLNDIKIKLDSEEFEKNFDIYSTDRVLAMQILTADVMQVLTDFKKTTGIHYEMSIKDSTIYFRFRTGSMFEPNYKNSIDKDTIYRYYKVLEFTLNVTNKIIKIIEETEF